LADFNNFWHETSGRDMKKMTLLLATTVATLPCEMQVIELAAGMWC